MSALGAAYEKAYASLCGRNPHLRPWHFQWLAVRDLNRALRAALPGLDGVVLDVGCGHQPYRAWLGPSAVYRGLDVEGSPGAEIAVRPGEPWPLADGAVDAALCTQVLEHVDGLEETLKELARVLKAGGVLVVSVPFIYNEHGAPHDYRRLSIHGLRQLLERDYSIERIEALGAIGASTATLFLNWLDSALASTPALRVLKGALLPAWLIAAFAMNVAALGLDALDRTRAYYGTAFAVARRRA